MSQPRGEAAAASKARRQLELVRQRDGPNPGARRRGDQDQPFEDHISRRGLDKEGEFPGGSTLYECGGPTHGKLGMLDELLAIDAERSH